jgi:hypothetical protein
VVFGVALAVVPLVTACARGGAPQPPARETSAAAAPPTIEPPPPADQNRDAAEQPDESAPRGETGEPAPSGDGGSDGDEAAGASAEQVYLDWMDQPVVGVDLDGDGREDKVSWKCKESYRLVSGKRVFAGSDQISELIGCQAAVFDPDPTTPDKLLVFCLDEHEEVGADSCWFLQATKSELIEVAFVDEELWFYSDGTWLTTSEDCDDSTRIVTTTEQHFRWKDGAAVTETVKHETPLDMEYCPDDP